MYLDVLFGFIILLLWRSKGCGQTFNDKIVSPSVVEAGGSFTLKCDASRAGVPVDVTTVAMLIISWKFGAKTEKLAHYYTYIEPNISTFRENWNFSFSGNLQRTTQFPKNRNTMRIEVAVSSAKCADAGSYVCYAQHLNSRYDTIPTESFQNLTITFTAPRTMSVNVNPPSLDQPRPHEFLYDTNSKIEITCSVEKGVNDINFRWMFGSSLSNVSGFLPLTAQNAISVTKTNSSGSTCSQFRHSSTLRIKTEEKYDGYMYMCMATDNRETISGNMTIYVLGENFSNRKSNNILSLKEVREGESFKVTCDATRAGVSYMVAQALEIGYNYGKKYRVKLAEYTTSTPPKKIQSPPSSQPARNWTFNFDGTFSYASNLNLMKIEITVYDAKSDDAGLYSCKASYKDQFSDKNQNLTILARVVPLPLSVFPNGQKQYESVNPAGSNVTLTCNVYGPRNVTLQWKLGNRLSNFSSFMPYPVQNHISYAAPVVDSDAPCVKYLHSSTLRFQTENKYDGYTYVCVAKENMRDTIVGNMTIYTKP